jgi:serine/threonine protein phosphatase PrpC
MIDCIKTKKINKKINRVILQEDSQQGMRRSNEDYTFLDMKNEYIIFCVFDGHGGSDVSEYLKWCMPKIWKDIHKMAQTGELNKKYSSLFSDLQKTIEKKININGNDSGWTGCITYINKQHNKTYIFNIGDWRAIGCNIYNIANQLWIDHKPTNFFEMMRIKCDGGKILKWIGDDARVCGLWLSRAFGDTSCKKYVICTPTLYIYDNGHYKFYVSACDG